MFLFSLKLTRSIFYIYFYIFHKLHVQGLIKKLVNICDKIDYTFYYRGTVHIRTNHQLN